MGDELIDYIVIEHNDIVHPQEVERRLIVDLNSKSKGCCRY